ncbi:MAG: cobalamin-dependent protein [Anaerolineae bacterium]|nr:cobalamin-dependent protein [Anaerolineae bacterium]MCA9908590.1 cobalamin-dependent protein [Anaerolineae bacterium]
MVDAKVREALIAAVTDLNEAEVLGLVNSRLRSERDPMSIVVDCQEGLRQVGIRYEAKEYFLSGLIMGGEIFREVMELVQPVIEQQLTGNNTGTILMGTVQGDIHDIGKNNFSLLLSVHGFTVHDLGTDVSPAEFLLQAAQVKPDIIGLSGLLTSSYDAMRETISLFRNSGDDRLSTCRIIIGGNQLNEEVCQYVKADYWVNDAMAGVRLCQQLMKEEA